MADLVREIEMEEKSWGSSEAGVESSSESKSGAFGPLGCYYIFGFPWLIRIADSGLDSSLF